MDDQAAKARAMLEAAIGVEFAGPVHVEWNASAVWAFTSWIGDDVEVSFAGKLTRGTLRQIFAYAFGALECTRCTAHVGSWNPRMSRLMGRIGFTLEGTKRRAFMGSDVLIYGMLREECKYYVRSHPRRNFCRNQSAVEEGTEARRCA